MYKNLQGCCCKSKLSQEEMMINARNSFFRIGHLMASVSTICSKLSHSKYNISHNYSARSIYCVRSLLQLNSARSSKWITPNKRSAVQGYAHLLSTTPQEVELLRSSDRQEAVIPRTALRLFGVIRIGRLTASVSTICSKLPSLGEGSSLRRSKSKRPRLQIRDMVCKAGALLLSRRRREP
jgi:hypothetical protein